MAPQDVDIDRSQDFGIFGLLSVLAQGSASGSFYNLSGYTPQQLVTMGNQAKNIGEMASNALRAVANMMMSLDNKDSSFNNASVGGLIELLTDMVSSSAVIETNAAFGLEERGYSASGKCLSGSKAA